MTFRDLDAFDELAALGGCARAAEALSRTQPTVSGQTKELEHGLNVVPRAITYFVLGVGPAGVHRSVRFAPNAAKSGCA